MIPITPDTADAEDEAARWALRLDAGEIDDAEQRRLDAWLAGGAHHRGMLVRARAVLAYVDRAGALAAGAPGEPQPLHRRGILRGALAFGVASAAGVIGVSVWSLRGQRIDTELGEVRRVPLADGSMASVNTLSQMEVTIAPERRRVRLDRGEAWFQVAHDARRPFVVEAGNVRVRAVGTAFSVRRRPEGADVLVTEGAVEVWTVSRERERRRVAAGFKSFVADAAARIEVVSASLQLERTLAWRNGELALDGESLGFAAAELNRYNTRKLVIDDEALAREPLVGYFRTSEPENFSRAAAHMLGARVVDEGETIRLTRSATKS